MRLSMGIKGSAILVAALTASFLAPARAMAEGDQKGWIGAVGGLTVPAQDDSSTRPMLGITGGAKIGSEMGVGGYFFTSSKDEGAPLKTFSYDLFGVEFGYHFEGEARGVYLAARVGTSKVKAAGVSASPMNYGAVAGYNYFLNEQVSVGGEVNFFSVTGANDIDGFTMLNFLGSAKFWF
jgi:hypothetical protein